MQVEFSILLMSSLPTGAKEQAGLNQQQVRHMHMFRSMPAIATLAMDENHMKINSICRSVKQNIFMGRKNYPPLA